MNNTDTCKFIPYTQEYFLKERTSSNFLHRSMARVITHNVDKKYKYKYPN